MANRIAGILQGVGDDPLVPRAIREIDRIRSAALAIWEGSLPAAEEGELFARLLEVAKRAELPVLAAAVILEEIAPAPQRPPATRPISIRARQLRRAGYKRCPCCALDVIDEATERGWEERDSRWLQDQQVVAERRDRIRGVA